MGAMGREEATTIGVEPEVICPGQNMRGFSPAGLAESQQGGHALCISILRPVRGARGTHHRSCSVLAS